MFSYSSRCFQNLTAVVERVAQFLNKELSKDTIDDIAEKCSFKNLKAADATLKGIPEKCFSHLTVEEIEQHKKHKMPSFFRKGNLFLNSYTGILKMIIPNDR